MLAHETSVLLMSLIFIIGYFFITIEHFTKVNKATVALLMAIACWAVQFKDTAITGSENSAFLGEHLANISQVVFFILGALTVVETISVHQGFRVISDMIKVHSKRALLWTVGLITFFLSAVLDNLTTTIVMVTLLQKLLPKSQDRYIIGAGIVIAANAGGAWTPIGDVTTTMLWIGGQISSFAVMKSLFIPSVVSAVAALGCLSCMLKGNFEKSTDHLENKAMEPYGKLIFMLGLGVLVFVPVFKALTGLPPFMGILFGLGILWLITDLLHRHYDERKHLRVPDVLSRIDLSGVLFFFAILLCIDALDSSGALKQLALYLERTVGNLNVIALIIGVASAIVDNVPLVAATMSMYDLSVLPQDHFFWHLIAYTAGTGGSMLIIGSAAGIVFMGLEKVDFFWYLKRISLAATVGYFAGAAVLLYF